MSENGESDVRSTNIFNIKQQLIDPQQRRSSHVTAERLETEKTFKMINMTLSKSHSEAA